MGRGTSRLGELAALVGAMWLVACGRLPAALAPQSLTQATPNTGLVFAVLGDGGDGSEVQREVGRQLARVCAQRGCQFALYLGDNIYHSGVDGRHLVRGATSNRHPCGGEVPLLDRQMAARFERPFGGEQLAFPFYTVMGNHDYGGNGLGIPFSGQTKLAAQLDYGGGPRLCERRGPWRSGRFVMPSPYYRLTVTTAGGLRTAFMALDSSRLVWGDDVSQRKWLERELAKGGVDYRFVFSHHTYRSSGKHGDAGEYPMFWDMVSGSAYNQWITDSLCPSATALFTGHDHHLEHVPGHGACPMHTVLSGAAAEADEPREGARATAFFAAGFAVVELVDKDRATLDFYDSQSAHPIYSTRLR